MAPFDRALTPLSMNAAIEEVSRWDLEEEEPSKNKRRKPDVDDFQEQVALEQSLHNAPALRVSREIIQKIFKHLDRKSQRSLIFLCHRIHTVALPEYLARSNLTFRRASLVAGRTELSFMKQADYNAIKLLCISPLYKNLHSVWFHFNSPDHDNMLEAANLVKTLEQVGEVRIFFNVRPANFEPDSPELPCWIWDSRTARALAAILTNLAGKGCKYLNIKALSENSKEISSVPYNLTEFPRDIPLPGSIASSLTRASISTPMIAAKYLRTWLLFSLAASPLQRLTIRTHAIPKKDWSQFFSILHLPHLTRLELDIDTLPPYPFADFLMRHPSISTLHLDQDLLRTSTATVFSDADSSFGLEDGEDVDVFCIAYDALPNLRELTAPSVTLAQFFRSSCALPALSTLRIPCHRVRTKTELLALAKCMRALSARDHQNDLQLELYVVDIDRDARLSWGAMFGPEIRVIDPNGRKTLDECIQDRLGWQRWVDTFRSEVAIYQDNNPPCRTVKKVEIHLFKDLEFTTDHILIPVTLWLKWVPCVETLVLRCEPGYKEEYKRDLIDSVRNWCPSVQRIEFFRGTYMKNEAYERNDAEERMVQTE